MTVHIPALVKKVPPVDYDRLPPLKQTPRTAENSARSKKVTPVKSPNEVIERLLAAGKYVFLYFLNLLELTLTAEKTPTWHQFIPK